MKQVTGIKRISREDGSEVTEHSAASWDLSVKRISEHMDMDYRDVETELTSGRSITTSFFIYEPVFD